MKRIRSSITAVLLLLLCTLPMTAQGTQLSYSLGDTIQDFTFTTYQGEQFSLYDILEEKKAVLINIWATWCGPCRSEFPYMQEAYELYQDQVEVVALSCESTDTHSKLSDFADKYGLSFKVGRDPVGFLSALGVSGIPTSLLIDRFGTICFVTSGALPDAESFTRLFDAFIGDDYSESVIFTGLPPKKPTIASPAIEELTAALNDGNAPIAFSNPTGSYTWPMLVTEKDGRMVAASSNSGVDNSVASVIANMNASQGDAIAVTFKVSSESIWDVFQLRINGSVIKSFAGNEEWQTYAYRVPADGEYTVEAAYNKNQEASMGEDMLWIDSISLQTGKEADAAVSSNIAYPISDTMAIRVMNDNARKIHFDDPTGRIASAYGDSDFYLVPDDIVSFSFDMTADVDPETAIVYFNYDGQRMALADCLNNGTYTATSRGDSVKTTGYCDSSVVLYSDQNTLGRIVTYFKTEEDIDTLLAVLTKDASGKVQGAWTYEEISVVPDMPEVRLPSGPVDYTILCVDQYGNPVQGAMMQICDEETCQVLISDADGMCSFTGNPYAWEVHVLMAPAGYTADSADVSIAPVTGGLMTFTFTKAE